MRVKNPYAPGLLPAAAWNNGNADRSRGRERTVHPGASAMIEFAYERGYQGTPWHRSPNGQLKWDGKC